MNEKKKRKQKGDLELPGLQSLDDLVDLFEYSIFENTLFNKKNRFSI